jgi:molybdopterin converting factor small subunit
MIITVKLFAHFRNGRFKEAQKDFPDGVDCLHIIESLDFTARDMGIVMVNGLHAALTRPLEHQDTLALFPLVGGG